MNRICYLALALLLATNAHAGSTDPAQQATDREVDYLIEAVAGSGCDFERNGHYHDASDAAEHLRMKYQRGKRYADTSEHFIERLATKSSWTGKAYKIHCQGNSQPSGEWLLQQLHQYRSAAAKGPGSNRP